MTAQQQRCLLCWLVLRYSCEMIMSMPHEGCVYLVQTYPSLESFAPLALRVFPLKKDGSSRGYCWVGRNRSQFGNIRMNIVTVVVFHFSDRCRVKHFVFSSDATLCPGSAYYSSGFSVLQAAIDYTFIRVGNTVSLIMLFWVVNQVLRSLF